MPPEQADGGAGWPDAAADRVVAWVNGLAAPPAPTGPHAPHQAGLPTGLARPRVLAVEGRSGSGKTSLAAAVAGRLGAPVLHMDDFYPGWDGLTAGVRELRDRVLIPLAHGRPAVWRRWDWAAGAYAEEHRVPDADWVVVEGVGSGGTVLRSYLCGVVWLESATARRKRRALARDGAAYAPHWTRWARQEDEFYAAERVREAAGLIIRN